MRAIAHKFLIILIFKPQVIWSVHIFSKKIITVTGWVGESGGTTVEHYICVWKALGLVLSTGLPTQVSSAGCMLVQDFYGKGVLFQLQRNFHNRVAKITLVPYMWGLSLPLFPTWGHWYKHRYMYPQGLGLQPLHVYLSLSHWFLNAHTGPEHEWPMVTSIALELANIMHSYFQWKSWKSQSAIKICRYYVMLKHPLQLQWMHISPSIW
jgi:hypothetical protein